MRELRNIVTRLGAKYPGQVVDADQLRRELALDYAATEEPAETDTDVDQIEKRIKTTVFGWTMSSAPSSAATSKPRCASVRVI